MQDSGAIAATDTHNPLDADREHALDALDFALRRRIEEGRYRLSFPEEAGSARYEFHSWSSQMAPPVPIATTPDITA